MSKKTLPEYSLLVRWGVQDVINWLTENGFQDCVKVFREAAIDGNRLLHIEEPDLKQIKCPSKKIKSLLKIVDKIQIPENVNLFSNQRPTLSVPASQPKVSAAAPSNLRYVGLRTQSAQSDDDDFDDSDFDDFTDEEDEDNSFVNGGHGQTEEIYEEPVDDAPPAVPPPRAGRARQPPPPQQVPERPKTRRPPAPMPQDSTEEEYEDPDQALKVQNFHRGPLPTPPSSSSHRSLPPREPAVPPQRPSGPKGRMLPPTPADDSDQDDYVEPNDEPLPKPPNINNRNRFPAPNPEPQAVYEMTEDDKQQIPPHNNHSMKLQEDQPVYELPAEEETQPPPPPPPPGRNHPPNAQLLQEQDVYEIPAEELSQAPSIPRHRQPLPQPPSDDDYLDMGAEAQQHIHVPQPVKSRNNPSPRLPSRREPEPVQVPEDEYINRDPQPEPPLPRRTDKQQSTRGVSTAHHQTLSRSTTNELDSSPWYFGSMLRNDANSRLQQYKENGMFLVRKSDKDATKPYTLALYYQGRVYNLQITKTDEGFVLGTADRHTFKKLDLMIEFFSKNYLVLQGGAGETQLKRPLPK